MELLTLGVLALLGIAAAHVVSPRIGIATPLILIGLGIAASFVPDFPTIEVSPEIILEVIIPPLLYAAAVSIPATDFRREFRQISGLSVGLVLVSTGLLAVYLHWLMPELGWAWCFALGALVSPTDPVATGIIKRLGVNPRLATILEGESMLNDAVALVLLRGAIAATAASFAIWNVAGVFVMALTVAVIIGYVVGRLNLWVRSYVKNPTVNTVVSLTVPFVASIPAEELGASGLVAAVVAGLVTGNGAAKNLSPQHRQSDRQTWKVIEVVLEGFVYLIMGLELLDVVEQVRTDHFAVSRAVTIAFAALAVSLVIRAGFISPLLAVLRDRVSRAPAKRDAILADRAQLEDLSTPPPEVRGLAALRVRRAHPDDKHETIRRDLQKAEADASYLLSGPLGWREGGVLVWAGMRGAVTIAAAQTLPADAPERSLLVLIAFVVATASLVIQGGTIRWVIQWLKPSGGPDPADLAKEKARLHEVLADAAAAERKKLAAEQHEDEVAGTPDETPHDWHLALIKAQRRQLIHVRDLGLFSSEALEDAMAELDADQIRYEL